MPEILKCCNEEKRDSFWKARLKDYLDDFRNSAIQDRYALNSNKSDTSDSGTHFVDLYMMEAVSLTEHCEDFVRHQGNADLHD